MSSGFIKSLENPGWRSAHRRKKNPLDFLSKVKLGVTDLVQFVAAIEDIWSQQNYQESSIDNIGTPVRPIAAVVTLICLIKSFHWRQQTQTTLLLEAFIGATASVCSRTNTAPFTRSLCDLVKCCCNSAMTIIIAFPSCLHLKPLSPNFFDPDCPISQPKP